MNLQDVRRLATSAATASLCLLILAGLAGCISDASLPSGCGSVIPAPLVGESALYDAVGELITPTILPFGMWGADDPPIERDDGTFLAGRLRLPEGSKVQITVGPPQARMHADGQLHDAYQVGYRVWSPERQGHLDAADEWLAVEDGRLIQQMMRQTEVYDWGSFHNARFTLDSTPPFMWAAMFWGQRIDAGWSRSIDVRSQMNAPVDEMPGHSEARLAAAEATSEGCRYTFTVTYEISDYGPAVDTRTATVVMGDWQGLPLWYSLTSERLPDYEYMPRFAQRDQQPGQGAELPVWQEGVRSYDRIASGPSLMGMPGGSWGFPTELSEAVEAVRGDALGAWLRQHPDATLAQVVHRMGSMDPPLVQIHAGVQLPVVACRVLDSWQLAWYDADSRDEFVVLVTKLEKRAPLCQGGTQVEPADLGREVPKLEATWNETVLAPELVRIHEEHFGVGPEYVQCSLRHRACLLGTHNGTTTYRAGENGAEVLRSPMLVGLGTRWLHSDWTADSGAVPPPVQHPKLG